MNAMLTFTVNTRRPFMLIKHPSFDLSQSSFRSKVEHETIHFISVHDVSKDKCEYLKLSWGKLNVNKVVIQKNIPKNLLKINFF